MRPPLFGSHTVADVDPTDCACAMEKRSTAWQQNTLPTQWRFPEVLRIQHLSTPYDCENTGDGALIIAIFIR